MLEINPRPMVVLMKNLYIAKETAANVKECIAKLKQSGRLPKGTYVSAGELLAVKTNPKGR